MYMGNRNLIIACSSAVTDKGCDKVQSPEDETGQPQTRRKKCIFKQEDD